jgi:hypothetical protein
VSSDLKAAIEDIAFERQWTRSQTMKWLLERSIAQLDDELTELRPREVPIAQ